MSAQLKRLITLLSHSALICFQVQQGSPCSTFTSRAGLGECVCVCREEEEEEEGNQPSLQTCSRWKATGDLRKERLEHYSNSKDYMVLTQGQAPERKGGLGFIQHEKKHIEAEIVKLICLDSFSITGFCVCMRFPTADTLLE